MFGFRLKGVLALLIVIAAPQIARAQDAQVASSAPLLVACVNDDECEIAQTVNVAVVAHAAAPASRVERQGFSLRAWSKDAGVMLPMYAGFATLQMLDVHATTRAIANGATEQNPMMSGIASHPAALALVKGGMAASTIYMMEHVRRHNRVAAIAIAAGINSAYAMIVVHNYRAAQ